MPAGSAHPGGAQTLYGDGHCDFTSSSVDLAVWRQIGSRTSRQQLPPP
jgi:prepilin-type processing-associated H-X9-DG protein